MITAIIQEKYYKKWKKVNFDINNDSDEDDGHRHLRAANLEK